LARSRGGHRHIQLRRLVFPRSALVLIVCCVFDFEKISRWTHGFSKHEHTHTAHTHRATYGGVAVCGGVCVWSVDVRRKCVWRVDLLFSGWKSSKCDGYRVVRFVFNQVSAAIFWIVFSQRTSRGKSTRHKAEDRVWWVFVEGSGQAGKGVSFAAAVGTSSRAILKKAVTFLRQKRRTGRTFCSLHLLCGVWRPISVGGFCVIFGCFAPCLGSLRCLIVSSCSPWVVDL